MQTVAEQITGRHWYQQSRSISTVVFFVTSEISLHVCGWEGERKTTSTAGGTPLESCATTKGKVVILCKPFINSSSHHITFNY